MKESEPVKPRRKYNGTFKREAVENWLKSGKSAEVIGRELGIEAERLYVWRGRFSPPSEAESADLKAQLEALRGELARVTEQRDI